MTSAIELIVGCAGWSLPFLAAVYLFPSIAQPWGLGLYTVALVLNYPHYMATIYRAYRTREDLSKYRVVTVYVTALLAAALIIAHLFYRLIPWLVTLYITWSPWHYMGQNFGLAMMFIHRNGIKVERKDRNTLWAAFVASYLIVFLTLHTGTSDNAFVFSLGLPGYLADLRVPLLGIFMAAGGFVLGKLIRQAGWKAMVEPITLFVTEFLWFGLPTLIELLRHGRTSQAFYSSGILAVMHCAQYLWITNYYARREANAEGIPWHWQRYFGILIIGGIVLFIPGPWLASYVFGRDFTLSGFVFGALVNIHHFILDGTVWKFRDRRVRSLLTSTDAGEHETATPVWASWAGTRFRRLAGAVAFAILLVVTGMDQVRYYLSNRLTNASSMALAADMNPYDSQIQTRLGRAYSGKDRVRMEAAFREAVRTDPDNMEAQNAIARMLLESGRYDEAYAHYKQMFAKTDPNAEALMNFGALCKTLGRHDEAVESFQRVLKKLPGYSPAQVLLVEERQALQSPIRGSTGNQ
jgi:hypothetical protein